MKPNFCLQYVFRLACSSTLQIEMQTTTHFYACQLGCDDCESVLRHCRSSFSLKNKRGVKLISFLHRKSFSTCLIKQHISTALTFIHYYKFTMKEHLSIQPQTMATIFKL